MQQPRIEFAVAFMDEDWLSPGSKVEVHFDSSTVTVVASDLATLLPMEWDTIRERVSNSGHSEWSSIYNATPLGAEVGRLAAPGMMAFGALHVLVPDFATATAMIANFAGVSSSYVRGVRSDGMGNRLRLIQSSLTPAEQQGAQELFGLGMFHRLDVNAYLPRGDSARFSVYFAPFHTPGVATSQLSSMAIALRDSLP